MSKQQKQGLQSNMYKTNTIDILKTTSKKIPNMHKLEVPLKNRYWEEYNSESHYTLAFFIRSSFKKMRNDISTLSISTVFFQLVLNSAKDTLKYKVQIISSHQNLKSAQTK